MKKFISERKYLILFFLALTYLLYALYKDTLDGFDLGIYEGHKCSSNKSEIEKRFLTWLTTLIAINSLYIFFIKKNYLFMSLIFSVFSFLISGFLSDKLNGCI